MEGRYAGMTVLPACVVVCAHIPSLSRPGFHARDVQAALVAVVDAERKLLRPACDTSGVTGTNQDEGRDSGAPMCAGGR